ncbi:uncharacterized protein LOC133526609 [Cydia pomonella]|uniref:uncharacterized protein LOC133526609 n=1 Tax=Cydia pomonella TaxID=82600 RepID=UPI002ADDF4C3|nr:uncharacterized protein LOC133526609 [Cydia pomonella]
MFFQSFTLVTDKPVITYSEPSVFPFVNISAARYRRNNVQYFTTVHLELAVPLDDNYIVDILFYENVNNQYRRSFIELQFKFCTFIFKDPIFGAAIRKQMTSESCPIPAGAYNMYNMTAAADHLPKLPFSKGRIYMYLKTKSKPVLKGYCDMELKRKRPPKH